MERLTEEVGPGTFFVDQWMGDVRPHVDKLRLLSMLIDNKVQTFSDWAWDSHCHEAFFGALGGILSDAVEALDKFGNEIALTFEQECADQQAAEEVQHG